MGSRVAKNPVVIPSGVEVKANGQDITVKGKQGQLSFTVHSEVSFTVADDHIQFAPANDSTSSIALAGTNRALVNNMVTGVSEGFIKKLVLIGVGYRAQAKGDVLDLSVGLSHPVNIKMPEGVTVETPAQTEIVLKGVDKQKVCQIAANIRSVRPPEPYKGKGIRYEGEHVALKEAKKK